MPQVVETRSVRTFIVIWAGQLVSLIGTEMTGFALGVWVYQSTGSVTLISIIILCASLPSVLAGPAAGALVDRWDRRMAMILSDSGAALGTLTLALLFLFDRIEMWHIWVVAAAASAFSAFQWPAYASSVTLLVPRRHLARASGAMQMGQGAARVLAPLLGGVLVTVLGVGGILMIDLGTFLVALATLAAVSIPRPQAAAEGSQAKSSLWSEIVFGWAYLRKRSGLLGLMSLFAVVNFAIGFFLVLTIPLVLSFSSAKVLGTVLALSSIGMLAGSAFMTAWGGPRRKLVRGIALCMAVLGLCMAGMGLRASAVLIAAAAFGAMFLTPLVNAMSQAVWQMKTAPGVQGRVFALRLMVAQSAMPFAYVLAGPLADRVFEPWMASGSGLAAAIGGLIGLGDGRGIGLLMILMGLFMALSAIAIYFYPRLRHLEEELPDMVAEEPSPQPGGKDQARELEPVAGGSR